MVLHLQIKVSFLQFRFHHFNSLVVIESLTASAYLHFMSTAKDFVRQQVSSGNTGMPAKPRMTGNVLMGTACTSAQSANIAIAN